ncbi:cytosine/purines uracil thiamine allantoin permease [Brucella melitensis]|nr:cytosine/purines uracil thiamine allantoin permease [Brucella melitensis]
MTIKNPSPSLYNEDLAPAEERKWGAFSIFNVWTSDVHSLWGYYLAASLFLLCGSFLNFVIAIGAGSLVIFFLMSLVGNAGVRTGVPFPVLARLFRHVRRQFSRRSCAAWSPFSGMVRKQPRASGLCRASYPQ